MSRRSLTRKEADDRGRLVVVGSASVALDLADVGSGWFSSRTVLDFSCTRPGASVVLDLVDARSVEATINGSSIDVRDAYDRDTGLRLQGLRERNVVVVSADLPVSTDGHGLACSVADDGSATVYTHLQPDHARRVFACFDQPDLKAVVTLDVTVPVGWSVVGHAVTEPIRRSASAQVRTVRIGSRRPLPPYVVAFAAGPLRPVATEGPDGVGSTIWARAEIAHHVDGPALAAELTTALSFFEDTFDIPCPFRPLDLVLLPDFAAGAMENAGCIFVSEDFAPRSEASAAARMRRYEMVLHETAHQWFGNMVTPRWWDDLWLNEAFATWAAIHALEQITGTPSARVAFTATKKATAIELDTKPSRHPVAAEAQDVVAATAHFDMLTYAKGAALIAELAALMGTERFLDRIGRFLERHADGVASRADLVAALGAEHGDLESWQQRLRTTGVPVLRVGADGSVPLPGTRVAVFDLDAPTTGVVRTDRARTHLAGAPRPGQAVVPNHDGAAYLRTRLDPVSVRTLSDHFHRLEDPVARAVVWSDVWQMLRHQELSPSEYLRITASGLRAEPESALVQRATARAAVVLRRHVEPRWAVRQGWPWWTARLEDWARDDTHPERALLCARAFLDAPLDEPLLSRVRQWWDEGAIGARRVDEDLRWRLARARAAHGDLRPEEIDSAFAAPHQAGVRARVRASLPSPEAKQASWAEIVEHDELPSSVRTQAVLGLTHPAHAADLAVLTERYFLEVPGVWRRRGDGGARLLARELFPHWAATAATLLRAREAVDDPQVPRELGALWRDAIADLESGLASRRSHPAGGEVESVSRD